MASSERQPYTFHDACHQTNVLKCLHNQCSKSQFCDVVLRVSGDEIYAHSNILAAGSPYFESFLGRGEDVPRAFSQQTPQIIEILIDGGGCGYGEAVARVVEFMYTSRIDLTKQILTQVMEIAKIMQMAKIIHFCQRFEEGELGNDLLSVAKNTIGTMTDYMHQFKPIKCLRNKLISESSGTPKKRGRPRKINLPFVDNNSQIVDNIVSDLETNILEGFGKSDGIESRLLPTFEKTADTSDLQTSTSSLNEINKSTFEDTDSVPKKRGRPKKVLQCSEENDSLNVDENCDKSVIEDSGNLIDLDSGNMIDKDAGNIIDNDAGNVIVSDSGTIVDKDSGKLVDNCEKVMCPENTIYKRTRGKKPITSFMGSSKSSRHKEFPNRFGKDFVIQPILTKQSSHNSLDVDIKNESGDSDNDIEEDMEATDSDDETMENETELSCKQCNLVLENRLAMRMHVKNEHGSNSKKLSCTYCSFVAKRKKQFKEHIAIHLHSQLLCSYCDFQAESEEHFVFHMGKHSGPRPYFCGICDSKFKFKTQLTAHMQKHNDFKPFICPLCPSSFRWKHALKNHMITHKTTKEHLCDICGFATAHKSQLKAHHLIHTGEMFKCQELSCKFQTIKRQNLKYHMLTHTHEKPHQCEVCGQSFSLVKNMKRHMLLHEEGRPYSCDTCLFTSTRYDKLKDHVLKQHANGDATGKTEKPSECSLTEEQVGVFKIVDLHKPGLMQTLGKIGFLTNLNVQGAVTDETQIITQTDCVPIITQVQYEDQHGQLLSYENLTPM